MEYMKKIREMILDICDDVQRDFDAENGTHRYRLEEWLDNNVKFRELTEYITGSNVKFDMNMRVKDLRAILSKIEDENMKVIIPVLDKEDDKYIHGFRHVRTAGILLNQYEQGEALCLSAPGDGLDMESQLAYNSFSTTECKRVLF